MADTSKSKAVAVVTTIGGPSHETLREAFSPKSLDELAADFRRRQFEGIAEAIREGEARTNLGGK